MIFSKLSELFFPPRCLFCGEKISSGYKCDCCKPQNNAVSHYINTGTGKNSHMLTVYTPYKYDGIYKKSLLDFKFRNKRYLAKSFADFVCDCILICNYDIITFVPMTKSRIRQRGYNQAELFSRELAKNTGIKCAGLLNKTADNKTQHTLKAKDRKANVRGVFDYVGDIKGQRILIVDDIITTGATIGECAAVLYKGGAKSVSGICIADAHSLPATRME